MKSIVTLTVVRLHRALVTLMPAFLTHRLPFVVVAALKNLHEDVNQNERRHKQYNIVDSPWTYGFNPRILFFCDCLAPAFGCMHLPIV
jgi:hypothetical protein